MSGCRQRKAVAGAFGAVREEPEVFGGPYRGLGHETDRLTRIEGFQQGDLLAVLFDQVGNPVQQPLSLGSTSIPPFLKRRRRRAGRPFDLFRPAVRDGAEHGIVYGGGILEGVAAGGLYGRTADEMADAPFAEPCDVALRPRLVRMFLDSLDGYDACSLSLDTTSFSSAPSPSTSNRSRSPAWMWEIPSGVPDQTMSPGFRVM